MLGHEQPSLTMTIINEAKMNKFFQEIYVRKSNNLNGQSKMLMNWKALKRKLERTGPARKENNTGDVPLVL